MALRAAKKTPSLIEALLPILCLIVMLSASVYIYGDDSSYGGNQIALIICAGIASVIGIKNGYDWKEIESGIIKGISTAMGAILILLAVGAMIGTWIMSGLVPAMIYYGLNILSPSIFYFAASIICALSALSIGSSWTVAGTLGAALMGIAAGLGLSPEVTDGAVISGAYFGDKMSPLSDTTNLAPAVAGTDLFTHINHMIWTTGPSLLIALCIFLFMGLDYSLFLIILFSILDIEINHRILKMFNFFKKNTSNQDLEQDSSFDIELVAYALAYEVAIADGAIDNDELARIKLGLENISIKLSQSTEELFQVIEEHTQNSVSFYEFVEDINSNFNKEQKLALIKLLWETAYADNVLEVNEERLIRRIADLIRIKSSLVLKLKEEVRTN